MVGVEEVLAVVAGVLRAAFDQVDDQIVGVHRRLLAHRAQHRVVNPEAIVLDVVAVDLERDGVRGSRPRPALEPRLQPRRAGRLGDPRPAMRAQRLPNGNILVPRTAVGPSGQLGLIGEEIDRNDLDSASGQVTSKRLRSEGDASAIRFPESMTDSAAIQAAHF